jgi:beta-lactamase regulating signal transducer with metallopeptidase domain
MIITYSGDIIPNTWVGSLSPALTISLKKFIPLLGSIWFLGVLFFSIRLLFGFVHLYHLKITSENRVPEWLQKTLNSLKEEFEMTEHISIALSEKVVSPMVMGIIRPIIVFPIAVLNSLSQKEAEMILRHELGHILRSDFLHNLVLNIIEVFMFYHPCVWWTAEVMRKEREHHCDDYVIQDNEDRMIYAKTLYKIRAMQANQQFGLGLSFSTDSDSLFQRIKRILNQNHKMSIMKGNVIVLFALLSSILFISAGSYFLRSKTNSPVELESKSISKIIISNPSIPMHKTKYDTLKEDRNKDSYNRDEVRTKIREKRDEIRKQMRELKEEIHREYGDEKVINLSDEEIEDLERNIEVQMESFEKRMEEMGDKLQVHFESDEFQDNISEIAEWGGNLGAHIAESILDNFDGSERNYHWNYNHSDENLDFDFSELGNNIGDMVSVIVDDVLGSFSDFNHSFVLVNPDKDSFVEELLSELKSDGYYKKNKVDLRLDANRLNINGKSQSDRMFDKYSRIVNRYHDIEFENGKKFIFKYSDKKGNISSSIKMEINKD